MASTEFNPILATLLERRYHSCHWIAVRCVGHCTDVDLLAEFGLITTPLKMHEYLKFPTHSHVGFADSNEWLWIGDGPMYLLWNNPQFPSIIERLSGKYDIFQYFLADCYDIWQVRFYQGGQLVRKIFVWEEEPDPLIRENFGEPLLGEPISLDLINVGQAVATVTEKLGIRSRHRFADIRLYEVHKIKPADSNAI